jgi:hypothetical protein
VNCERFIRWLWQVEDRRIPLVHLRELEELRNGWTILAALPSRQTFRLHGELVRGHLTFEASLPARPGEYSWCDQSARSVLGSWHDSLSL